MLNQNLIESRRREAEVYRLVEHLSHGMEPAEGAQFTVDCRLGNEGPDSWSRWTFEATAEQVAAATKIFLNL